MKGIKFRIYDIKGQCMVDVDTLYLNEEMFKGYGYDEYAILNYGNDYYSEPMQFTGLYDKNDVEIYEGDIIKLSNQKRPSGTIDFYQDQLFKIIFRDGCFIAKNIQYNEDAKYYYDEDLFKISSNSEVIGNIYENKNLLERKER